jgi:stage II sporulation protein AA (anti-sigma F factor antagonist)
MPFTVQRTNLTERQTLWQLSGRLDSNTSSRLEQPLLDEVSTPNSDVILDCSGLLYISSAGLRVILMAAKRAKQNSSTLVLCSLQTNVHEVFDISGFLNILTVEPDLDAAQARLSTD